LLDNTTFEAGRMCLAVPGKIVSIVEDGHLGLRRGKVDFAGIRKEVCLDYTPNAGIGDYVLVHVGFALATVDEKEAQRVFEALRELDQLDELKESGL
jgi:hydrogenase expression/formation protein HypC